ncbi:hypothetical protein HUN59_02280 [Curtobacterium sp. Csp2]|uniref:hypothetical protein n=1 Tax=Curtobacterium sp. Csp2 TaxID=2495430 RepID=UPI0015803C60|nr:hypothetical protein [Curtobacterium sp. Csp2]QKS15183.1 hypothetical protein HUN59_02280 [Curtobacterium sp. Csp2]
MTLRSSHTTLEQRQPHAVVPGPQKVAVAAAGGPFPGGADVALDGPPSFIWVGPVRDRRFAEDGRLIIERDGVEDGDWAGTDMAPYVAPAAALALILDVLHPDIDEHVGGRRRFVLDHRLDGRGDLRGGLAPEPRWAYGSLFDHPIDTQRLTERASLVHTRFPAHPSFDGELFHWPHTGRFVEQLGPGATWFRNGARDYFDQVLSLASHPRADHLVAAYRRRWVRAELRWARRSSAEQRRREGPWT